MQRLILFLLGVSSLGWGLTTQYVTFDNPEGWKCENFKGTFYCQGTTEPEKKESLVMSIAAIATEWDSLENFEKYLSTPRNITDEVGTSITSKITFTRKRNINGAQWIDSLHFESELPGFWTRYLATVHNRLAILITYIVSEKQYSKAAPQFERMVSSLKTNSEFNQSISPTKQGGEIPGSEKLGAIDKNALASRLNLKKPADVEAPIEDKNDGPVPGWMLMGAGILVVMAFAARLRKKNKKH